MIDLTAIAMTLASRPLLLFILVIIASALWGDVALISMSIFAVGYGISIWIVFFAAYIGTLIGDVAWFAIGNRIKNYSHKHKKFAKNYHRLAIAIDRVFRKKHLLALTIVKYLYGTRVITIFYLAREKIGYKKFIYYDLLSSIFWIAGMGGLGYSLGLGFIWLKTALKSIQIAASIVIILLITFFFLEKEITEKILKK